MTEVTSLAKVRFDHAARVLLPRCKASSKAQKEVFDNLPFRFGDSQIVFYCTAS